MRGRRGSASGQSDGQGRVLSFHELECQERVAVVHPRVQLGRAAAAKVDVVGLGQFSQIVKWHPVLAKSPLEQVEIRCAKPPPGLLIRRREEFPHDSLNGSERMFGAPACVLPDAFRQRTVGRRRSAVHLVASEHGRANQTFRPRGSASVGPELEPDRGRTASRFAGTALSTLPDLGHDVSGLALIERCVDFRDNRRGVAEHDAGRLDSENAPQDSRGCMPQLVRRPMMLLLPLPPVFIAEVRRRREGTIAGPGDRNGVAPARIPCSGDSSWRDLSLPRAFAWRHWCPSVQPAREVMLLNSLSRVEKVGLGIAVHEGSQHGLCSRPEEHYSRLAMVLRFV